ncbi:MAG: helix-hairpin-helix domain-containing protein [Hymenobacteraceae bacterium]|nr:helix-hairpin-helix domain-containing protein [Hymenobacteraceae bacterium]MDX5397651.1 helix-hairpin-helix domain-containing protein [Hymenobacteraceae bacterium]MDX5513728.1 helix-hairpin-helix domain-containing protein [Hymenobacteraceae bacterium]
MKQLKRLLQQYFGFSPREVNGFLLLLAVMVLVVLYPVIFKPEPEIYNPEKDQQTLDSLVALLEERTAETKTAKAALNLKPFNPNKLTEQEWKDMGLQPFLAKRILNYRSKIGDFKTKEELGKIYGLPDTVFQALYPYILLPSAETKAGAMATVTEKTSESGKSYTRNAFRLAPFDINEADTLQLKQIRGIGSKLSARIVTYRDKLGGFHNLEQLQEVWGLSVEVIDSLHKYSFISSQYQPQQIPLNSVTLEELRTHPYLKPYIAKAIIAYRQQHGNFQKTEDLKKVKLVDENLYQKLQPYLSL